MKNFNRWLFLIALSPIFILFGASLKINKYIVMLFLFSLLSYPFFLNITKNKFFAGINKSFFLVLIGILGLIIANIILSIDPIISLLYWIIYLLYIYGINSWIHIMYMNGKVKDFLYIVKNKLGYYIFLSSLIIFIGLTFFNLGNARTLNSLGIITGSAIVYFWFLKSKPLIKTIILLILIFFVVFSLSRSSLIITALSILITEIILLKKNFLRKLILVFFTLAGFIIYRKILYEWFEKKEILTKIDPNNEVIDLFLEMNSDRKELIDNFTAVYDKNFFTGYGINTQYQKLEAWDAVNNIGVHNGILEMILVIGVPLSLLFLYFYIVSFKNIFKLTLRNKEYAPILGFVVYISLRSYGESYFLLNIGNIMSIFFLMILVFFYNINVPKLKLK